MNKITKFFWIWPVMLWCLLIITIVKVKAAGNETLKFDKAVRSADQSKYFDNLSREQKIFLDREMIDFSLNLNNQSTEEIKDITINDRLPDYLVLVINPGNYVKADRKIEIKLAKLAVGESKSYLVRSRIDTSKLATDSASVKLTNLAEVKYDDKIINDSSYFFIGPAKSPITGNEDLGIKTAGIVMVAVLGLVLRKFSRGY